MSTGSSPGSLKVGGTLQLGHFYVERDADDELAQALLQGEFCYVLAPRQMGKSSLRVRTMQRLLNKGIYCAFVDLGSIGGLRQSEDASEPSEQQINEWYITFLTAITRELDVVSPASYWMQAQGLTSIYRLVTYFHHKISRNVEQTIVIFIDEIDVFTSLGSERNSFFAAIRLLYNLRADDPALRRLTFCILGKGTPASLMIDPEQTPFNIGIDIQLDDFTRAQCESFATVLSARINNPAPWLDEIYHWSEGHPCITQQICKCLLEQTNLTTPKATVGRIVDEQILQVSTEHYSLFAIENEFSHRYLASHVHNERRSLRIGEMLSLYKNMLSGAIVCSDKTDPVQLELRLSGLAATRNFDGCSVLRVRNPIIAHIFDQRWVSAKQARRFIDEPLRRWLESNGNPNFLLGGDTLRAANEHARTLPEITAQESHFLVTSLNHQIAEQQRQRCTEETLHKERERRNFRRSLSVILAILVFTAAAQYRDWLRKRADILQHQTETQRQKLWQERIVSMAAQWAKRRNPDVIIAALRAVGPLADETSHTTGTAHKSDEQKNDVLLAALEIPTPIRRLRTENDCLRSVAFSPDGEILVLAGNDNLATVWETNTWKYLGSIDQESWVVGASFLPMSRQLATIGSDGEIRVCTVQLGKEQTMDLHRSCQILAHRMKTFASSEDGAWMLMASLSGGANLRHATQPERPFQVLPIGEKIVEGASFSPAHSKKNWLLLLTEDHEATLLKVDSHGKLTQFSHLLADVVNPISGALSSDGQRVALGNADGDVVIINLPSNNERAYTLRLEVQGYRISALTFSPDGSMLATGNSRGNIRFWKTSTGQELFNLDLDTTTNPPTRALAFSPDGRFFVAAGSTSSATVWAMGLADTRVRWTEVERPSMVALSPDGRRMALVGMGNDGERGQGYFWKAESNRMTKLEETLDLIDWLGFSPDGKHLLVSGGTSITIYDGVSGRKRRPQLQHTRSILATSYCPDGSCFLTSVARMAKDGGDLFLFRTEDGTLLRQIHVADPVYAAAFVPGTTLLAAVDDKGRTLLLESSSTESLQTGSVLPETAQQGMPSGAKVLLRVSKDGVLLARAGTGCVVDVWSLLDRRHRKSLVMNPCREGSQVYLDFALDGQEHVLVAGYEGIGSNTWNTQTWAKEQPRTTFSCNRTGDLYPVWDGYTYPNLLGFSGGVRTWLGLRQLDLLLCQRSYRTALWFACDVLFNPAYDPAEERRIDLQDLAEVKQLCMSLRKESP